MDPSPRDLRSGADESLFRDPGAIHDPPLAKRLRAQLAQLADEIIAEIGSTVPAYQRPMEGDFGRIIRTGVESGLSRFVDMIATGEDPRSGEWRSVYENLGRAEMYAGRSLDALQAAYRVGARVAWRRFAAVGEEAEVPARKMSLIAEAVFAYIDELSAASVEGYAEEQAARAGEAERRRRRLVRILIQDPPAARETIREAAKAAGVELPATAAAVAVVGEQPERLASRLGHGVLAADADDSVVCAIVPDPDAPARRRELEAALQGRRAAIGPPAGWDELGRSLSRARAVLGLAEDGAIPDGHPLLADEHLVELLLRRDPGLARDLAQRALAPLTELSPATREKLAATLRAWLDDPGHPSAVARALHVHPQTVRYRLARLRELFGEALDDPGQRFELALALRIERLLPAVS